MAVKVLIKRKFKEGNLKAGYQLITHARYNAMKQAGYISSETLSDLSDPRKIMVVSMWHKIDNWNSWVNSDVRKKNEAEFEKLLDAPTEYEMYNLGVQL
ncbi:MAG: antibiotic biosynthesis monooxygenase [Deltaproteobacteria bacterium]|jgi:heme-degrading monooxygenase HmoA|nr:MAG: antibiotic biosynthesis monooxygenase [Deltaproteobacteria bacterium]